MKTLTKFLSCISIPFLLLAACATGPIYEGPSKAYTPQTIMAGKTCNSLPRNNFGLPNGSSWVRKAPDGMSEMTCGPAAFYLAVAKDSTPLTWTTSIHPGHNMYALHGIVDLLQGSVDVCVMSGTTCKVESYKVIDKPIRIVVTAPQVEPLTPSGPMVIKIVGTSDKTIVGQVGTAESIN